jgi:uncharacterized membrane protein YeiH
VFGAVSDGFFGAPFDAVIAVSLIGTLAFALSGVMAAAEAGMDWLGGVVLAVVAAIGGGTIRDLLIGNEVFWISNEWPLLIALVTAAATMLALRARPTIDPRSASWYVASDAVGLGAFVVVGTSIALESGTSYFIAAFMGVITGVGGGVLRDIFARRMPIVFVGEIYAVAGLFGAVVHLALVEATAGSIAELWIPLGIVVLVRAAAVRWSWRLPRLIRGR